MSLKPHPFMFTAIVNLCKSRSLANMSPNNNNPMFLNLLCMYLLSWLRGLLDSSKMVSPQCLKCISIHSCTSVTLPIHNICHPLQFANMFKGRITQNRLEPKSTTMYHMHTFVVSNIRASDWSQECYALVLSCTHDQLWLVIQPRPRSRPPLPCKSWLVLMIMQRGRDVAASVAILRRLKCHEIAKCVIPRNLKT